MLLFLDINNTFSTVRYRFFLLFLYLVFWQCYILYKLNRYYYQSSACELILFLNEHPCILLLCLLTKHLRLNLKYFMSVLLCPLRSLIACFTVWLLEKRAGKVATINSKKYQHFHCSRRLIPLRVTELVPRCEIKWGIYYFKRLYLIADVFYGLSVR